MVYARKLQEQEFQFLQILQGSSRKSEKEYAHFLEISIGSSFELETQLLICERIKLGDYSILTNLLKEIEVFQRMMYSFCNKLKI